MVAKKHYDWQQIGKEIALNNWGQLIDGIYEEGVKRISDKRLILCLLCATVSELREVNRRLLVTNSKLNRLADETALPLKEAINLLSDRIVATLVKEQRVQKQKTQTAEKRTVKALVAEQTRAKRELAQYDKAVANARRKEAEAAAKVPAVPVTEIHMSNRAIKRLCDTRHVLEKF